MGTPKTTTTSSRTSSSRPWMVRSELSAESDLLLKPRLRPSRGTRTRAKTLMKNRSLEKSATAVRGTRIKTEANAAMAVAAEIRTKMSTMKKQDSLWATKMSSKMKTRPTCKLRMRMRSATKKIKSTTMTRTTSRMMAKVAADSEPIDEETPIEAIKTRDKERIATLKETAVVTTREPNAKTREAEGQAKSPERALPGSAWPRDFSESSMLITTRTLASKRCSGPSVSLIATTTTT